MSSLRDGLLEAAARIALQRVGASPEETEEILKEFDINLITTWDNHQIWARTILAQLRARPVDEGRI